MKKTFWILIGFAIGVVSYHTLTRVKASRALDDVGGIPITEQYETLNSNTEHEDDDFANLFTPRPPIADPSAEPCFFDGVFYSQWRMIADFDGDGVLDMALTEIEPFGDCFTIYLRTKDGYKEAGVWPVRWLNPVSIEYVTPGFTRLWASHHISGRESYISCMDLIEGSISTDRFSQDGFELRWFYEDDVIPTAISRAIFDNSSTPVRLERSAMHNGVFVWAPQSAFQVKDGKFVLPDSYAPPKDEPENPSTALE